MKEEIAVDYRGTCSECHQARERSRIPCHNPLRSLPSMISLRSQLFARYCAAQRYREKSRKSGRPSGVRMSVE